MNTPNLISSRNGRIKLLCPMQRRRHGLQHWLRYRLALSCLTLLSAVYWVPLLYANPSDSGSSSTNLTIHRRPPFLKRKLQSWMIRHQSQTKFMNRMDSRYHMSGKTGATTSPSHPRGSILTFQRPTKERIFRWFGIEGEDPNQVLRCMMARKEYNHPMVGITNPFLHIGNTHSCYQESDMLLHGLFTDNGSSTRPYPTNNQKILPASRVRTAEKSWWPSLQTSLNEEQRSGKRKRKIWKLLPFWKRNEDWRILIYRKSVGNGLACYERVRDAVLDWDFQSDDGTMGIVEVPVIPPSGGRSRCGQQKSSTNNLLRPQLGAAARQYSVRPVIEEEDTTSNTDNNSCAYRSLGASSRRFVTYATSKFMASFKRRLYAVNPVMVVYDLVDQRAPGTTFTSTAYATLKGHWLQGEERVTVALRDGSDDVDVEILSISRAGPSLWGKTMWPFVGSMQTKFFEQHLDYLARTGALVMNSSDDESRVASRAVHITAPSLTTVDGTTAKSYRRPFTPSTSVQRHTALGLGASGSSSILRTVEGVRANPSAGSYLIND